MGILVRGQVQSTSTVTCDVRSTGSSATNCDYEQWDSAYASRSQATKNAAWDSKPGETCGVMDPTLRPGTSMSRSNLHLVQAQLMQEIKKHVFTKQTDEKKKTSTKSWSDMTEKE